jgi:hypothetical protein
MDLQRISPGVVLGCSAVAIAVVAMAAGGIGLAAAAGEAPADLTIVFSDGPGLATTWHLTCSPDGGDHPDPAKACTVLTEQAQAVLLTPPAPFCTQASPLIYGGPQTAQVKGTWRGQPVDIRLTRTDGCQIARWTALAGLLPAA